MRKHVGLRLIRLASVDSTNAWLLKNSKLLIEPGIVVYADEQVAGRGRFDRKWFSGKGENLYCSILVLQQLPKNLVPAITIFAGLAVYQTLRELPIPGISVKWPNDILVQGKKISGILSELKTNEQGIPALVIGIGVNLAGQTTDFPLSLRKKVTTVEEITGKKGDRKQVLEILLNHLDRIIDRVLSGEEILLFREWEHCSNSIGKKVSFSVSGETREGNILGLNNQGWLKVIERGGTVTNINSGEIFFL